MIATIRAVIERDLAALIALCVEHARYEGADFDATGKALALSAALFDPSPRVFAWVAECDAGIVGYATAAAEFSTWAARSHLHLDCLFARADARGQGIGASLLRQVREYALREGYARIEWQTPSWNEGAIRFYRREGALGASKERFGLDRTSVV